jgi:hypothetical protein
VEKDQGIRSRQERLFLKRLQYYQDGLGKKGHTQQDIRQSHGDDRPSARKVPPEMIMAGNACEAY